MPKNTKPIRKVYVFILEGVSDENAIAGLLKKLYRNRTIYSVIMYGDVTSDIKKDISKIVGTIAEKVRAKLNEEKIKTSDVLRVFQICDMDGAYVPDTAIVKGKEKRFVYSPTSIAVPDVDIAKERNSHKREAINMLLSTQTVLGIPYRLYFMSSNLEHVLFDIQNLEDSLKTRKADEFFETFRDYPEKLISFLESVSFGVPKTYSDSWDYIKQELHSLERHNNLIVCFNDFPTYAQ